MAQAYGGASIEFDGSTVTIRRERGLAAVSGLGTTTLAIEAVTGVRFKPARWWRNGRVVLLTSGGTQYRRHVTDRTIAVEGAENTILFTRAQGAAVADVVTRVRARLEGVGNTS